MTKTGFESTYTNYEADALTTRPCAGNTSIGKW